MAHRHYLLLSAHATILHMSGLIPLSEYESIDSKGTHYGLSFVAAGFGFFCIAENVAYTYMADFDIVIAFRQYGEGSRCFVLIGFGCGIMALSFLCIHGLDCIRSRIIACHCIGVFFLSSV